MSVIIPKGDDIIGFSKIRSKNRVVIPEDVLKILGIESGDAIVWFTIPGDDKPTIGIRGSRMGRSFRISPLW
jgi:bifunctional DNA-binding transcriptional regulator/antitoxin component of YhaV-PrlF toxin-antitoxin module